MTFEEAVRAKQTVHSNTNRLGDRAMEIFVTPESEEDFMRYALVVKEYFEEVDDEDARAFSSNGKFKLRALAMNGSHLMHSDKNFQFNI